MGKVGATRAEPRHEARLIVRVTVEAPMVYHAAGDALTSARAYSPSALPRIPQNSIQICVLPGDAAIAACEARVRDALVSTQFRDDPFC